MDKIEQAIDELVKISWHVSFKINNSYASEEVYDKYRVKVIQKKMELIALIKEKMNA